MNGSDGKPAPFHRLVVLADSLAPSGGAFSLALDWSRRLRLPLYVLAAPWLRREQPDNPNNSAGQAPKQPRFPPTTQGSHEGWEQASACCDVQWDLARWESHGGIRLWQALEPEDLLVFSHALSPLQKRSLLGESLGRTVPAVLICTKDYVPISRVLLLHQAARPNLCFLARAARLCADLGARIVVLTVARFERRARREQQAAREALACYGVDTDFDFLVGSDVQAAVASVAHWRGCRLVLLEQQDTPAWWRWLRGGTAEQVLRLADTISVLALRRGNGPRVASVSVASEPLPGHSSGSA